MKDKPFKQATPPAYSQKEIKSEVAEALAIHAARQKPKSPPNAMPVTPKLPRVRKPHVRPRAKRK